MFKRWAKNVGAVVALLLVTVVSLIILMVGANFLQPLLIIIYQGVEWTAMQSVQASSTVRTFMNFYYVICGILFLGFFVLMEHRLVTTGVPKKLVLRRTVFTLGVELLVLVFFHLGMLLILPVVPIQIGLTVTEAVLGIGLIAISRRKGNILPWVKEIT